MPLSEIATARRRLRAAIRATASPLEPRNLIRSPSSRDLFLKAMSQAMRRNDREVHLLDLAAVLFAQLPREAQGLLASRRVPLPRAAPSNLRESRANAAARSPMPTIEQLGRDLSALARAGRLSPVVGRDREIKALARMLQRTTKANAIVVGDAGVGKTAIVEGLA